MNKETITFEKDPQAERGLWSAVITATLSADNNIETAISFADKAVAAYRDRMPNA